MYGITINNESSLSILDIGKPIYTFDKKGYSIFQAYQDDRYVRNQALTRILVSDFTSNTSAVAFEEGCVFYEPANVEWSDINERYLEVRHGRNSASNFYIFSEFNIARNPLPKYGVVVYDQVGKVIFHSSLNAMKILGHASKLRGVEWYTESNHIGKKYAFIQIGFDISMNFFQGSAGRVGEMVYFGSTIRQSGNSIIIDKNRELKILKQETISRWPGWVDQNRRLDDVIWMIIDVSDF